MADQHHDDDLHHEGTPGFKIGEKKTLDEYKTLDAEDESLRKWKESLGVGAGGAGISDPKDPRTVIIHSLGIEVEGRPDIIVDLTRPGALENLKSKPFVLKEGVTYRMKVVFQVQHEILSGLRYNQVVKRLALSEKSTEMIGSYGPNTVDTPTYKKTFEPGEAPSGMMGRGTYDVTGVFVDDDNTKHLKLSWKIEIKKNWE